MSLPWKGALKAIFQVATSLVSDDKGTRDKASKDV